MRCAVVDHRMTDELQRKLLNYADRVLRLPPHPSLPKPVASHPDMLMWFHKDRVVTFADYAPLAKQTLDALSEIGYTVLLDQTPPKDKYPHDVPMNCATVGNKLIANTKFASRLVLGEGLEAVHTQQGYAKCATVTVSDNAIISADPSICQAAKSSGIHVLAIQQGHVHLEGYDTGFIGGCTGVTETEVLFTGDLTTHPDGQRISDFCAAHGKKAVSLSPSPLYDYGTVFFVQTVK